MKEVVFLKEGELAPISERSLSDKVTKWLKEKNIYFIKPRGGAYGKRGASDYIICLKGKFIALEVKGSGGKVSPSQRNEHSQIQQSSGLVYVVYPDTWNRIENILDVLRITYG